MIRHLAFLHWLQPGAVRQLQRYYQDAMTSCCSSRRTPLPSFGGTPVALVSSLLNGRAHRRGLELVTRYLQPGVAEETTGSPKFLGNPDCPFAHVQSTPAGLLAPDHYDAAAWPLVCEKQRLPRKVFRRSIAWLSDSLSTLRRTGQPATTQDSLPAAGQALPDGLFTRKVPMKGFKGVNYISFPFPKLAWRNCIDRLQFEEPSTRIGQHTDADRANSRRSLTPTAVRQARSRQRFVQPTRVESY